MRYLDHRAGDRMDADMTDLERDLYTALRMFVYGSAPSDPDERLELAKAALERAEGKR